MSKTTLHTAPCRFCKQMVQLDETEYTEEQAIEEATMRCRCSEHQSIKRKKTERKKH